MPNWKKLIVSGSDAALNSLNVANAVTASAFRSSNGVGTPTLISPNNIILSASNAVVIKDSVLRLDAFTNAETGSLTPQAGDLIYNSDRADVLIYTSSKWLSVLVEGDASTLPDGILSSSIQIGSDISGSFTSVSESLANRLDSTITTASAAGSTITFTKEDSSTFQVTLTTATAESSSYVTFENVDNKPTLISSSIQIASDISGSFITTSASLAQAIGAATASISDIIDGTITVTSASYAISSSHEITYELSSSHAETADEVPFTGITGKPTLISSSIQIGSDISGSVTSLSESIATRFDGLTSDYTQLTNIPTGIVSSSVQIASDISGSVNAATASLITTASTNLNTITFTQGDGSTFNVTVNTGSGAAGVSSYNDLTDVPSGIVSSSVQIGSDISGSVNAATGSLITTASAAGSNITFTKGDGSTFAIAIAASASSADSLVTASVSNSTMTFTKGDSSTFDVTLPGGTVSQEATYVASFTNTTTTAVTHSFDTRNVLISVYDGSYNQIIPQQVTLDTVNTAKITFSSPQTGTVVVAKGGHLVTGSIFVDQVAITSDTFTNTTTKTVTHNFATKDVIVSVYNDSDEVIIPQTISTPTGDTVSVTLSSPASGRVVVAKAGHIISASVDHVQSATSASLAANNYHSSSTDFSQITFYNGDGATSTIDVTPRKVIATVKNMEVGTLVKGTPVYASGSSGNSLNVYAASASRADRMPASYVLNETLATEGEGEAILAGFINGVNTSTFSEGDVVYVGASGGYTNIKPTGTNLIQNLGKVIKVDASNGSGVIMGAGRSNDVPNIAQGYAWVGDSNGVAQAVLTSSFYVDNAITASYALNAGAGAGFPYSGAAEITGSLYVSGGNISGSFVGDGSGLTGITVNEVATVTDTFTSATTKVVTHNLNTKNVIVSTYLNDDTVIYPDSITTTDVNTVTVTFASPRTGRVVVAKGGHIVSGSASYLGGQPASAYATTGSNSFVGTQYITGSLLPGANETYDLGSNSHRWRDLYLSGSTIYLGDVKLSATADGRIETRNRNTDQVTTITSASYAITASYAVSASHEITYELSSSHASTADNVSFTGVTGKPTLLSGSNQIASDISGSFTALSASVATRFDGLTSDYTELTNIPSGIISSSAQIDLVFNIDNLISSSTQIASDISGSTTTLSASIATRFDGLTSDYTQLTNIPAGIISSSAQIDQVFNIDNVISSSNQIASEITGSFTSLSSSIATRFDGLTSDYTQLTNIPGGIVSSSAQLSGSAITGSFKGDGSGLTGVTATIDQYATFEDTFTNAPSHSAVHNFGTKNVFVQVFESDDTLLIPQSVTTTNTNQVDIVFGDNLSGRVVIGKAGHILQNTGNFVSSSTAVATFTNATSASISHNLDSLNVITQVFDSNNNVIVPSNIRNVNANQTLITFGTARSGKAVIAKAGHIVSGTAAVSSSYADTAVSASFATTASYAANAGSSIVTGSFTNVTSSIVTHNHNTKAVLVQVWDNNDYVIQPSSIRANSLDQVTVTFSTPESGIIVVSK